MKNFRILLGCLIIYIVYYSFVKCNCEPPTDTFLQFKLVNTSNNDLYSGATALYKLDSLKIFYKNNAGSLQQEQASVFKCPCPDSSISVLFAPNKKTTYYFYYNSSISDSINIEWKRFNGRCCGDPYSYDDIVSVKFKNAFVLPDTKGIYYFVR